MAGPAAPVDPAELTDEHLHAEVNEERGDGDEHHPRARTPVRSVVTAAALASVLLAGVGVWLGYGVYQTHQRQVEQDRYVAVARQAAVNLTTIDFGSADSDVARILASATGTFLDDFQRRAEPFTDVVRQAKSSSKGTVTEAGLESMQGDHGQVLVAVQVTTSINGAPPETPRGWRMRLEVQKVGDDLKVDNVQFVP